MDSNLSFQDLAARNILVNDTMLCKVSDFGLSRELETADSSCGEYATSVSVSGWNIDARPSLDHIIFAIFWSHDL